MYILTKYSQQPHNVFAHKSFKWYNINISRPDIFIIICAREEAGRPQGADLP